MRQLRDYPTYDEILAIEHAARRAQAAEVGRLAILAASELKARTLQIAAVLWRAFEQATAPATRSAYGGSDVPATFASIIEELGASLPGEVRARYAEDLATATRVAEAIDFGVAAWDFTAGVLAQVFQGMARSLRAGAWFLDTAARRLMLPH